MIYCRNCRACTTEYDVRLQDSQSARSGRVEVCYGGTWSSICPYEVYVYIPYYLHDIGNTVCKQLSFCDEGGQSYTQLYLDLYNYMTVDICT